ncbi:hypothetical protein PILCRDRAFT_72410 [Piloderma croceum F 1598]|uniref:Glycoside hydrolase family 16 protein n=1 Tax=Piloderma croceum (strain F 1598) TaxID=765440 RepID=A0A0C3BUE0_PILCF|nr:hypothetical protein PILCRDRAFT_72410 [Piloderma croceum F 1598]
MITSTLCFVSLSITSLVLGQLETNKKGRGLPPSPLRRRDTPSAGYFNPASNGGSLLTQVSGTSPPAGEPINVIVSGNSDKAVLNDTEVNGGLRNFFLSFGFSAECLGQHSGAPQEANLGDGDGFQNETAVIRLDYGNPALGSCEETVEGGNHFRYWVQNGPSADSGAVFMATSYEQPIAQGHNIVPNGYDFGRYVAILQYATFQGNTSFDGFTYQTSVQYVSGLLPVGSSGVNHGIDLDGLVAVMQVSIVGQPGGQPKKTGLCVQYFFSHYSY